MTYWLNRERYNTLLQQFTSEQITGREFESRFTQQWRLDRDAEAKKANPGCLNSFKLKSSDSHNQAERAYESVLSQIFTACDVFEPDDAYRTEHEYSEQMLRQFVVDVIQQHPQFFS